MSSMYITEPATSGKVCLETTVGDIDVELWCKECPLACRNFIQLSLEGYYNNVIFHRLEKDFIIQTGDPTGKGDGGSSIYDQPFKNEFHQRLSFNRRGLLGMAGEKGNNNGSQFFFTFGKALELNKKHTLFGKVVGNTVFNLLKLNECDVDNDNRPSQEHKILKSIVLLNPFNDIKPREISSVIKQKKDLINIKRKHDVGKNTALLSFGDEIEDEGDISLSEKKFKSKSAHDILNDEYLSKQDAVCADEIEKDSKKYSDIDVEIKEQLLVKIKGKIRFNKNQKKNDTNDYLKNANDKEENFDKIIEEQKEIDKKIKLEEISKEVNYLKKEYAKVSRQPKKKNPNNSSQLGSSALSSYNKMKLKFKQESKNIVSLKDDYRESQTMNLVKYFDKKVQENSVNSILSEKKIDLSNYKMNKEIIMASLQDQGILEEKPDLDDDSWLTHSLRAPKGIKKDARDANLKETDREWYSINDPRNSINIKRREKNDESE